MVQVPDLRWTERDHKMENPDENPQLTHFTAHRLFPKHLLMSSRIPLLYLVLSLPLAAQNPQPGGQAPGGELDFDKLRKLIEESKQQPELTPEQQQLAAIKELKFDRSTVGILETRLEEARLAKEPADPEAETPEETEPTDQERIAALRRDVVLGRWDKVREFLTELSAGSAAQVYELIIGKLSSPTRVEPTPELIAQGSKAHSQSAFLPPGDLLGLMSASPQKPQKKQIQALAKLLPKEPRPPEEFFDGLSEGIENFGGEDSADRARAAEFLLEAGLVKEAGTFLPDLDTAREKKAYADLNLIARHRAELSQLDPLAAGKDALPLAWELSTSFLSDPKAPAPAKAEAMFRALSLIPELGDETGKEWLEKTFNDPQGEGLDILASLGTLTALSRENPDASLRLDQLKLQHAAVKTLLSVDGADPVAWADIFTLYARQWIHESEVSIARDQSNSRRMIRQYDDWGNLFYSRPSTNYQGPGIQPISTGDLLECRPEGTWLASIETSTRYNCLLASARMLLKVKEEQKVLPIIKTIATTDSGEAAALVRKMISVWAENHNPNDEQDYRSRYMYFYGFNNQSGTIPLTRSKQERNLVELAELVKGIRQLSLDEAFHSEFAAAFISCHSQAEVWRVEAVESVFGATETLDPATLATLVGQMRLNLAGLWPNPKLQQAYKTNRKDKELQEQLIQGYQAAEGVLVRALEKQPAESWRLEEQVAAIRFEESNYRSTITPDHEHTAIKRAALEQLATSAKGYAATLPLDAQEKETTSIFETWFYAALGSPTLEALKSFHVASPDQYALIRAALDALPDECKERHLTAFASTLNARLANVGPDLKLRYLEGASEIVGDQKAMDEATEVLAYYRDLITEIELDASIDGSDQVGSEAPFGLRVNLRHTREIEREAGGFKKYLQNQNNSPYGFNYGRPTEDYRDKFEKASRAVLDEHFEIVSLTFHSDKVESLTDPEFGWRLTPYAYFLLKPKGPQIDRVPPLKIDLDFNDTSGYVVLPITSAEVPINAGTAVSRPFKTLKVTQTLDERSHKEKGSLYLEVKATAHGLVPSLEDLLDQNTEDFEIGVIEDRGLKVVELDAASEELAPISEHEWRIELKPEGGSLPATFRFPAVKPELAEEDGLTLQRYVDVDLVPVGAEVVLGPAEKPATPWIVGSLATALLLGVLFWFKRRGKTDQQEPELMPLPTHMNVVSVIGYLRRLQAGKNLSPELYAQIESEITALEIRHFGPESAQQAPTALESIAKRWQAV